MTWPGAITLCAAALSSLRMFRPQVRDRRADLTGLRLWPISLKLLQEYEEHVLPRLREQRAQCGRPSAPLRVLELGAGVGALGLGVAALGDAQVREQCAGRITAEVNGGGTRLRLCKGV